jgi:hypothetical protein
VVAGAVHFLSNVRAGFAQQAAGFVAASASASASGASVTSKAKAAAGARLASLLKSGLSMALAAEDAEEVEAAGAPPLAGMAVLPLLSVYAVHAAPGSTLAKGIAAEAQVRKNDALM